MKDGAQLFWEALGRPLTDLIARPDVSEVMLDPDGRIRIDRLGSGIEETDLTLSAEQAGTLLRLAASLQGQVIGKEEPEIAVELPDGSRLQGWLPPVAPMPVFAIRCRTEHINSLEDAIAAGTLTPAQYHQLAAAWAERKTMLICGGTGSGKTTLANAILASLHQPGERLVVLEDVPELHVRQPGSVMLRTSARIDMRRLVRSALRLRPDRICVGEVRDGSALDLLKAWNTGHPGGLSTLHANSADAALQRLEDLMQEAVDRPSRRLIEETIDLVIFIERDENGRRKVIEIKAVNSN
ncbi:P-type conjugative transfer ATPase TrbB [Lacibacterium aquatile]|uniref:P-type conjugative transfer ATPase TrbB n=1 Tax=Lacibacterium aquatile TaxID=1168082 RepID=A0ABW5DQV7_9PROT